MQFAKRVFLIAGIWGFAVLTPLFFLYDRIGREYPPPLSHPDFYFGFVAVALVWQVAFLVISRDPVRLRPIMLPAILEKFVYVLVLLVLYGQGRLAAAQAAVAAPDFLIGMLFVVARSRTPVS